MRAETAAEDELKTRGADSCASVSDFTHFTAFLLTPTHAQSAAGTLKLNFRAMVYFRELS